MSENNDAKEPRLCKKCNCELPTSWKHKFCENCRRERFEARRNVAAGAVAAVGCVAVKAVPFAKNTVLPAVKESIPKVIRMIKK